MMRNRNVRYLTTRTLKIINYQWSSVRRWYLPLTEGFKNILEIWRGTEVIWANQNEFKVPITFFKWMVFWFDDDNPLLVSVQYGWLYNQFWAGKISWSFEILSTDRLKSCPLIGSNEISIIPINGSWSLAPYFHLVLVVF